MSCQHSAGQNHSLLTDDKPLKMLRSLNIWKRQKQIKIPFTRKLRAV